MTTAEEWHDLGNGFRELGQYEDAVRAFRKALNHDVARAATWYRLEVCLILLRRKDDAEAAFRQALSCEDDHTSARYNLGVLLARKDRREALHHLRRLWRDDPDSAALLQDQLFEGRRW